MACAREKLMAQVAPLSSAVVRIEILAYARVVVHGYHSWCMSGSLAGQFRLWYVWRVNQEQVHPSFCTEQLVCSQQASIIHQLAVAK